ncbi:hypothetical protein SO802_003778 [Lithocarpus litseifolius]|uniref:CP12 domain-containing protein n=1 Tax=Lithocarpus litseifolius TaxID=425828 RepID=A0AAW2E2Z9_9ROSI
MACLAAGTGVVGCCSRTVRGGGGGGLSLSLRSEALLFSSKVSVVRMGEAKKGLTVKAMAVAPKFKGTQRREKELTELIEKKVIEAKEVCGEDERSDECKVAWDEVEEISQAKADLRLKLEKQDPLEFFCQDHPETDECRLYED